MFFKQCGKYFADEVREVLQRTNKKKSFEGMEKQ
jgi:hypothetical protein